jgi:hypothetical protein
MTEPILTLDYSGKTGGWQITYGGIPLGEPYPSQEAALPEFLWLLADPERIEASVRAAVRATEEEAA